MSITLNSHVSAVASYKSAITNAGNSVGANSERLPKDRVSVSVSSASAIEKRLSTIEPVDRGHFESIKAAVQNGTYDLGQFGKAVDSGNLDNLLSRLL